ncbi:MAG: hypothetical protein LBS74_08895 [Oscillospiraceae bacterium]|jgi:hypothetical protein|nr:hypothetical protein [Oscillospiraceae bacterium]
MDELKLPLSCATYHFVGKKPTAVIFSDERVEVKTWKQVFAVVLSRCNQQCHDQLMYLRNKVAGRDRLLLSDSPDGLRNPVKIDDDLYAASGYGSSTMMHILCNRILTPARFNFSGISVVLR